MLTACCKGAELAGRKCCLLYTGQWSREPNVLYLTKQLGEASPSIPFFVFDIRNRGVHSVDLWSFWAQTQRWVQSLASTCLFPESPAFSL